MSTIIGDPIIIPIKNIDASSVVVTEEFINPLNTDQLTLGQTGIYFTAYPSITWQVQHLDGDYAYLALYPMTETITFGSSTTYAGSTIAQKCTDYLNNTIPNVADCLEKVTVNGVTAKVFIPSRAMYETDWDWPKAAAANRICQLNGSNGYYWTSTAQSSAAVWRVSNNGDFAGYSSPSNADGFRPAVKVQYKGNKRTKPIATVLDDLSEAVSNVNPYVIGTTAPTNTSKLWIDTTATTGGLKYYNGSAWVHVPTAFTS